MHVRGLWCLVAITCTLLAGSLSAKGGGQLEVHSGQVRILRTGEVLSAGMVQAMGETVSLVTDAEGEAQLSFNDGTTLHFGPSTSGEIKTMRSDDKRASVSVLSLIEGSLEWKKGASAGSDCFLLFPAASLAYRGDHIQAYVPAGVDRELYVRAAEGSEGYLLFHQARVPTGRRLEFEGNTWRIDKEGQRQVMGPGDDRPWAHRGSSRSVPKYWQDPSQLRADLDSLRADLQSWIDRKHKGTSRG